MSGSRKLPVSVPPVTGLSTSRPTTAREALIAEALGDIGHLLDRIEALLPAMDASRTALVETGTEFDQRLVAFQKQLAEDAQQTRARAVQHLTLHTNILTRTSIDDQTRAMTQAARKLFNDEVGPTLKQLTESLQRIIQRTDRVWELWLTHAATAVTSAAIVGALAIHWLR